MTTLFTRVREVSEWFRSTRDDPRARDLALLAGRIALAWVFIYHGAGTLFGAFGRGGIHPQAVYFAHVAHLHPGTFFAVLGGIIEFFGGIAVGLGIFGRLAAAGLFGDMVMAMITVTFAHGVIGNSAGLGLRAQPRSCRPCPDHLPPGHGAPLARRRIAQTPSKVIQGALRSGMAPVRTVHHYVVLGI